MNDAKKHAEREYDKFKAKVKALRHEAADKVISEIKIAQKRIPIGTKKQAIGHRQTSSLCRKLGWFWHRTLADKSDANARFPSPAPYFRYSGE